MERATCSCYHSETKLQMSILRRRMAIFSRILKQRDTLCSTFIKDCLAMNRRSRKFTSRGEARSHSSHDSEDGQNVSGSRRSEVQRKRFGLRRMLGGMLQDHSLVPTQSTKSNTSNGQGCLRTTLLPEVLISKAGGQLSASKSHDQKNITANALLRAVFRII